MTAGVQGLDKASPLPDEPSAYRCLRSGRYRVGRVYPNSRGMKSAMGCTCRPPFRSMARNSPASSRIRSHAAWKSSSNVPSIRAMALTVGRSYSVCTRASRESQMSQNPQGRLKQTDQRRASRRSRSSSQWAPTRRWHRRARSCQRRCCRSSRVNRKLWGRIGRSRRSRSSSLSAVCQPSFVAVSDSTVTRTRLLSGNARGLSSSNDLPIIVAIRSVVALHPDAVSSSLSRSATVGYPRLARRELSGRCFCKTRCNRSPLRQTPLPV